MFRALSLQQLSRNTGDRHWMPVLLLPPALLPLALGDGSDLLDGFGAGPCSCLQTTSVIECRGE